jgi:hypothetical protein
MKDIDMGIEEDASTLARALRLERDFNAGIFPRGGAQWAHFRRLARYGMLRFTGEVGRDIDSEIDDDVWNFELTAEGRAWITQREEDADARLRESIAEEEERAVQLGVQERSTSWPGN